MSRFLVQVAMACIFAASALGFAQEAASIGSLELPADDTKAPADTPEPCEPESCSCDETSSDEDVTAKRRAARDGRALGAPGAGVRGGVLPDSHLPSALFRPPIG